MLFEWSLIQIFFWLDTRLFWLDTRFFDSILAFLTRYSPFWLDTRFFDSILAFLTRYSPFLTRYSLFFDSILAFLTRYSPFWLDTRFFDSILAFLTRYSLFWLDTRFFDSILAFLIWLDTRLFRLDTRFFDSILAFLTRYSLFWLDTRFFDSILAFFNLTRYSPFQTRYSLFWLDTRLFGLDTRLFILETRLLWLDTRYYTIRATPPDYARLKVVTDDVPECLSLKEVWRQNTCEMMQWRAYLLSFSPLKLGIHASMRHRLFPASGTMFWLWMKWSMISWKAAETKWNRKNLNSQTDAQHLGKSKLELI